MLLRAKHYMKILFKFIQRNTVLIVCKTATRYCLHIVYLIYNYIIFIFKIILSKISPVTNLNIP